MCFPLSRIYGVCWHYCLHKPRMQVRIGSYCHLQTGICSAGMSESVNFSYRRIGPTCPSHLQGSSSPARLDCLTLEDGTDRLVRYVGNYQITLPEIPEKRRSPLHLGGKLKPRIFTGSSPLGWSYILYIRKPAWFSRHRIKTTNII